jgi:predicted dehydrogenase
VQASKKTGRRLFVGLTHRFGERHRLLRSISRGEDPTLGAAVAFQLMLCTGNPISRWYDRNGLSGGMFVSSMFHLLDETLDFFGGPPRLASAHYRQRSSGDRIESDSAAVCLSFPGGCTAQLTYARGMAPPGLGLRMRWIMERGYVVAEGGGIRLLAADGERPLEAPKNDAIAVETGRFVAAVGADKTKGGPDWTAEASQATLEVACLAADMADGTADDGQC